MVIFIYNTAYASPVLVLQAVLVLQQFCPLAGQAIVFLVFPSERLFYHIASSGCGTGLYCKLLNDSESVNY